MADAFSTEIRLNTLSQSRGFDAVRRRGYVAGVPLVLCEVVRKRHRHWSRPTSIPIRFFSRADRDLSSGDPKPYLVPMLVGIRTAWTTLEGWLLFNLRR
jgi:DNA transposition AAA+ family ATPase